ncbi:MAG: NAD(P)-dependent glycerol-1-phosphate dehydrogenase [Candidatus Thermoplasmatota archaeon]|nr:NAD(P)-dependent glycerol-1-phosphate dehydrogenase [Candidatus Thermoplasmatota archaeon]
MRTFTKSKTMIFPREIIVGHKTISQVAELCGRISKGNNVLVVSDKNTKKIAGNKISKILKKKQFIVSEKQISSATVNQVNSLINFTADNDIELILGVGGGSVIDASKFAAHETGQSFVSIPTCASHDGIASPRASLKHRKGKVSKNATSPLAVLADTEIINKAPFRMLAAGCADVVSNIPAVLDWKLANRLKNEEYSSHAAVLSETAAQLIIDHADEIKPDVEKSVWFAVKAMIVSGVAMSVAGSTRPASGAEHMFSHMLDHLGPGILLKGRKKQVPLHGEQCGIGAIMMMYLHGGDWQIIRNTLEKIGAPTTSEELGVSKKKIIEALVRSTEIRPDRYTILGEHGLTKEAARTLAKKTGVI